MKTKNKMADAVVDSRFLVQYPDGRMRSRIQTSGTGFNSGSGRRE
jgi:hypothetical protein